MKIFNRISLRMRITLLSGAILLVCSTILAIGAAYNAHTQFKAITLDGNVIMHGTAIPEKVLGSQVGMISEGTGKASTGSETPRLTAARKQFDSINIIILAIVSLFGMIMVYIITGRSLQPIHELCKTVATVSEDTLGQHIPFEHRKDEIGALSHSFNIMLERLEKSFLKQKQFSANVAHELKTPLTTINAGIQVLNLEKSPTVSEYEQTFLTTERNIKRLITVVDDLLCLYEQQEFEYSCIDLQEMFESILGELRPILNEKQIETRTDIGLNRIYGNQVMLYRACFNLVENAVKYNQCGGTISIETKKEDGLGKIIISDTGNGIPSAELQKIFEPLYRVNKSRSRKTGGAGLGLSIVKAIVEKHGWKITVDSELEKGSSFTITLAV